MTMHRRPGYCRAYAIAAWVVFLITTGYLFRGTLFNPMHSVVSVGGDGGKNLFTYLYQIMYGHGTWFKGMNYPFGEHVIFTDGQPAVALPLTFLNQWLHLSPGALLGIMYYLVAFSFWLGMWYTYKLLLRFGTYPAVAIAAAACILILSPQLLRITGHFPLSYSTFLPMLFLWSLDYYETGRRKYLVWLCLLCICYALLHMYFLGMALIWMAAYVGGAVLIPKQPLRNRLWHAAGYALPFVAAFAAIQLFIAATDPVKDRPVYPLTSLRVAPVTELISTSVSPLWQGIRDLGITDKVVEGTHETPYLGIVLIVMSCTGLLRLILTGRKRRGAGERPSFHLQWIFIALATLLFAMTISAVWDISFLRAVLKPLRQFRAPERFGWIGYYILSVYSAVLLSDLCRSLFTRGRRIAGTALAVLVIGVWAIDANGYILETGKDIAAYTENYNLYFSPGKTWSAALAEGGKKPQDFRSVLALPYEHNGSEKLWLGEGYSLGTILCFMVSLETSLPVMNVMMSRTSWQQTFEQVKIGGGMYAGKPVFSRLQGDKPILLLYYRGFQVTPDEAFIIDHADSISTLHGCTLYALYPKKILALQAAARTRMLHIAAAMPAGDTVLDGSRSGVFLQHFGASDRDAALAGEGGQPAVSGTEGVAGSWQLSAPADTGLYECTVWTRLSGKGPQQNYYTLYCRDSSGQELRHEDVLTKISSDNLPGFWFRASKYFRIPAGTRVIEVKVFNLEPDNYLALDELMIRPAASTVISRFADGSIFVNNHRIAAGDRR